MRVKIALAKTPDMLPVLKEVGVVDPGGQGLRSSGEVAFGRALTGEYIAFGRVFVQSPAIMTEMINAEYHKSVKSSWQQKISNSVIVLKSRWL